MPNNVYIGSRYVPKFDGAWSAIKTYEPLTIVEYGNNSFTSKRPVPLNTPPTTGDDTDQYWALTGNYNGQIANLQNQINTNASNIQALTNKTAPFVTPEMFGAVGDGSTDDSTAIQNCINDAITNNKIAIASGNYKINSPIEITGYQLAIDFSGATIRYDGAAYAIGIHKCSQSTIKFGIIDCSHGSGYGIKFYSTSPLASDPYDFSQYVNIYGNQIISTTHCIDFQRANGYGWANEIRLYNICFSSGSTVSGVGVYIDALNCNGWRIHECGVEDIGIGLHLISNELGGSNTGVGVTVIDTRTDESFSKFVKTEGKVYLVIMSETKMLQENLFDLSLNTMGSIVGLIYDSAPAFKGSTASIINGVFVPSYVSFKEIDISALTLTGCTAMVGRTHNAVFVNESKGLKIVQLNVDATATDFTIEGLPAPLAGASSAFVSAGNIYYPIAHSPLFAPLSGSGKVEFHNAIVGNSYSVTCVYI